jgi:hypothetical protein
MKINVNIYNILHYGVQLYYLIVKFNITCQKYICMRRLPSSSSVLLTSLQSLRPWYRGNSPFLAQIYHISCQFYFLTSSFQRQLEPAATNPKGLLDKPYVCQTCQQSNWQPRGTETKILLTSRTQCAQAYSADLSKLENPSIPRFSPTI